MEARATTLRTLFTLTLKLTLTFPHKYPHSSTFQTHLLTFDLKIKLPNFSVLSLSPKYSIMFDFEKLQVYSKAKSFNAGIRHFLKEVKTDRECKDQLRRAAFSIVNNLAEGSGRFTNPDRRNFYVISRSSLFECIAILDVLKDEGAIEEKQFNREPRREVYPELCYHSLICSIIFCASVN